MAETQEPDGYYGDEDMGEGEINLDFLDEDKK